MLVQVRNQMGEGEGGLPCSFSKIGKKCSNLEKNSVIVAIYGYNFSFKMRYLSVSRRKTHNFFPAEPFFLVLQVNVYHSALIRRKLPCPKKFLVTRLLLWPSYFQISYLHLWNQVPDSIKNESNAKCFQAKFTRNW